MLHKTARDLTSRPDNGGPQMRRRAYQAVAAAVERGDFPHITDLACVDCGMVAQAYDHRDYTRPLDVEPVCGGCNKRRGPGYPYNQ